MRVLLKNQIKMKYSLLNGTTPVYETDKDGNVVYESYLDNDGNKVYYLDDAGNKIPRDTGEYETKYEKPQIFKANMSMSGGQSEAQEFGLDVSDYNAVLVCPNNAYPITETSLIWVDSEVGYKDNAKTRINPKTADYSVVKVSRSLNFVKYVLKKIVK